jgi:predicted patatin/cPLA2 family phospholipase
MGNDAEKIIERIVVMEQQLEDLKKRWPAHSVKPQMILEMEQLEEEIEFLREKYKISQTNRKGD